MQPTNPGSSTISPMNDPNPQKSRTSVQNPSVMNPNHPVSDMNHSADLSPGSLEKSTSIPGKPEYITKITQPFKTKRNSNTDLMNELQDEMQHSTDPKQNEVQGWTNMHRDSTHTNDELMLRQQQILSREREGVMSYGSGQEVQSDSIIKHYTKQLMTSGRTDKEIVQDLEVYYNQLCLNCDQEIIRLREQLELAQAQERSEMAEDLVLPM